MRADIVTPASYYGGVTLNEIFASCSGAFADPSPIPPAPMSDWISYGPSREPAAKDRGRYRGGGVWLERRA